MATPYEPQGGWNPNLSNKAKRQIQKRYAKGMRKHVLPVAAGTAGITRGAAKAAEVSLDEKGIRDTQGIANRADANLTNVLNSSQLGPFSRIRARAVVKKNVKAGLKEGGEFGRQIFKNPREMQKTVRKDLGR